MAKPDIEVQKAELNLLQNMMERHLVEDEMQNSKYKRRMIWLIPFNLVAIFAITRYCRNINSISKRFWPKDKKPSLGRVFLVSTVQATGLITFYLGGNLLMLGVNPKEVYKRHLRQNQEELAIIAQSQLIPVDQRSNQTSMALEVEGSLTMKDYLVVQSFKAMGLSDSTMAMIENDLRNQHVRSIPENQIKEAIASFPAQTPK